MDIVVMDFGLYEKVDRFEA